mmetsp:Transcript_2760/g.4643  ORF Transcript_2760/g.4643 Transcript_2760/m.4643 type:complete len:374 (+) Transcript_2760:136-1257(+)
MAHDARARSTGGVTKGHSTTLKVCLVHIKFKNLLAGKELCCKGFVDLDKVHVGHGQASTLKSHLHGGHRAKAHNFRWDTGDSVAHDASHGLEAVLVHSLAASDNNSTSTITDTRGVTSSNNTTLLEEGLELGEALQSGLGTRVLVSVKGNFALLAILDHDWLNLILKETLLVSLTPQLLAAESKLVGLFLGDVVLLSQVLRGDCHRAASVLVVERIPERINHGGVHAERRSPANVRRVRSERHGLRTSGKHNLAISEHDVLATRDNALEAGSAQAVDGERRGRVLYACLKSNVASEVSAIGCALRNITDMHAVDDVCAGELRDSALSCDGSKFNSGHILDGSAEGAERSALGRNHKDVLGNLTHFVEVVRSNN